MAEEFAPCNLCSVPFLYIYTLLDRILTDKTMEAKEWIPNICLCVPNIIVRPYIPRYSITATCSSRHPIPIRQENPFRFSHEEKVISWQCSLHYNASVVSSFFLSCPLKGVVPASSNYTKWHSHELEQSILVTTYIGSWDRHT